MILTPAGASLLETFEQIRIINLASRADRRSSVTTELARLGLRVDGQRVAFHIAQAPETLGGFPTKGAHGCFLSHLEALKEAAAASVQSLLILEDDIGFVNDVEHRMVCELGQLKSTNWGMFYGGHSGTDREASSGLLSLSPKASLLTSHFVGFNGDVIRNVGEYLAAMLVRRPGDEQGGPMHVDGAYNWYRAQNPQCITMVAQPSLANQLSSRSDVQPLRIWDRARGLRFFASLARGIRRTRRL